MNQLRIFLTTFCFLVVSLQAKPTICTPIEEAAKERCLHFAWKNTVRLAPIVSYLMVKYPTDPAIFLEEENFSGFIGGCSLSYERFSEGGFYAFLGSDILAGNLEKDGRMHRTSLGDEIRVFESNSKLCFGYGYTPLQGDFLQATPYLGVGFRFFYERLRDNFFVDRTEYFTAFLPIGFLISYRPLSRIYLGFQLEWFPDLDITATVKRPTKERYVLPRETEQLLVQLPAKFLLSDYCSLEFTPFWKRIRTARKDSRGAPFFLPRKERMYWGGNLGLGLLF